MPGFFWKAERTMPTEPSTVGPTLNARLRTRREEFGASTSQIANWSGLEENRISEIEEGAALRSWEFEALCRALAVDSGALAQGEETSPRRSVARFKSAWWVDPTPDDLRSLALATELGRIGGFLAEQVAQPVELEDLRDPRSIAGEPWRQGYRLGERARMALAPRPGPICDLEKLLTRHGIHVARVTFSSADLDAASLWERGSLPIILVNTRSARTRSTLSRRALLAHELCHLLHDSGEREITTQLSWAEGAGNYGEEVEQRARAFAPAFLAPRNEVKSWFQAGQGRLIRNPEAKVEELARRWGFSFRGAIWHAKTCELISARKAEDLYRSTKDEEHDWMEEFEKDLGYSTAPASEGEHIDEASPIVQGILLKLVTAAAAAGLISEGRRREIATWK